MQQTKQRIGWIDMAKGYGMLLVIAAHLEIGIVGKWIYTFHMPLFFFLSGYVFHGGSDFPTFFRRKFRTTVVPYFLLGLPMLLFNILGHSMRGEYTISDCIRLTQGFLIQRRMWALWFLACLFFTNLLFYWAVRLVKSHTGLMVLATGAAILGLGYYRCGGWALPWNVDVCLTALPFFCAGYLCKCRAKSTAPWLDAPARSVPLFILLLTINIVFSWLSYRISGIEFEMYGSTYGVPLLTFPAAFAGLGCVVIAAKWAGFFAVRYIGENSIVFYLWHQTIMVPIAQIILRLIHFTASENGSPFRLYGYKCAQFVLILGMTSLCCELINRTKLKAIIFGRG